MDLDLVTNGATIKNNVNSLNVGSISWIVLGYSNNRTINIVETGGDSFEDMFEEFDSNKIMYGFAAVTDPNTKLKKNVFIHWQGEAASQAMKTMSVQHSNIIRDLCKPIHVTHNARDVQDLDLKEIMTKVASASGSNYSCHKETKQVYENVGSVKGEENTAKSMRQTRLKELSDLGNLQKESAPEQHIGSTYEKVNATKEIQNLRNKTPVDSSPIKPSVSLSNYSKIDASKEIKSQIPNRTQAPYQNAGTNYVKTDASKEIKSLSNIAPVSLNTTSGYKKVNPQQELKSLNLNKKTMFEGNAKVQSENNTAQRAKEERQKEISNMFSKRSTYDDDADRKVGTNYTRVNPVADIKKLRSASITQENIEILMGPSSTYKKINPSEEFQKIRRSSSSDHNEPLSPGTNYKKINPAEEIKKLRSQSNFEDVRTTPQTYRKINPIEEINSVRKLSTPFFKEDIERNDNKTFYKTEEPPVEVAAKTVLSARQTFENTHKANNDVYQTHNTHLTKQEFRQEPTITTINTQPVVQPEVSPVIIRHTQPVVEVVKSEPVIVKETPSVNDTKNTAEAQFEYTAADDDEISFEEGEIIRDIEVIDDDWWLGVNAAGKKGIFPSSYVMPHDVEQPKKEERRVVMSEPPIEENDTHNGNNANTNSPLAAPVTNTISSSPVLENHSGNKIKSNITAIAIFDYEANDTDEISFDFGEIIKEIEQIDDGWWIGVNRAGVKGMFPSNFVEIKWLNQEAIDMQSNESLTNSPMPDQRRTSDSMKVRAIFDYAAQGEDEVSFNVGDLICNVATVDDGWWEGDVVTGQRGLFPSNYVETL